ncbi:hypothetical protein BD779DRAFT_1476568 [Infundibulicybe gibba]|nr:hypothetical protein BD779DRAFT_1476568 [Infundibulicybe gibba]
MSPAHEAHVREYRQLVSDMRRINHYRIDNPKPTTSSSSSAMLSSLSPSLTSTLASGPSNSLSIGFMLLIIYPSPGLIHKHRGDERTSRDGKRATCSDSRVQSGSRRHHLPLKNRKWGRRCPWCNVLREPQRRGCLELVLIWQRGVRRGLFFGLAGQMRGAQPPVTSHVPTCVAVELLPRRSTDLEWEKTMEDTKCDDCHVRGTACSVFYGTAITHGISAFRASRCNFLAHRPRILSEDRPSEPAVNRSVCCAQLGLRCQLCHYPYIAGGFGAVDAGEERELFLGIGVKTEELNTRIRLQVPVTTTNFK